MGEKEKMGKKREKKVQNSQKKQNNFNGSFPIDSAKEKTRGNVLAILFVSV